MKKIILFVVSVVSLWVATNVFAELKMERIEEAIEAEKLQISLDDSLNGHVTGTMCDHCKAIRVTITPDTTAQKNGVAMPLIAAKSRAGKSAIVIFDPKTLKVNSIRWYD